MLIAHHGNIRFCIEDKTYRIKVVLKLAPKNKINILVQKKLHHLLSYLISLADTFMRYLLLSLHS